LRYAYEAGQIGGTMPTVLNAANEIAVAAFLQEKIPFLAIPRLIRQTLDAHDVKPLTALADAFDADRWARTTAANFL